VSGAGDAGVSLRYSLPSGASDVATRQCLTNCPFHRYYNFNDLDLLPLCNHTRTTFFEWLIHFEFDTHGFHFRQPLSRCLCGRKNSLSTSVHNCHSWHPITSRIDNERTENATSAHARPETLPWLISNRVTGVLRSRIKIITTK